jgi:hypothetical protein
VTERIIYNGEIMLQALDKLKSSRQLSTDLLKPLGISMNQFLRYSQKPMSDAQEDEFISRLIAHFEKSLE